MISMNYHTLRKDFMGLKITDKMFKHDKMYGTTSLGSRGQVVIPAQARKDLNLKAGDKLVVMGKFGKALGLVKMDDMQEIISMVMKQIGADNIKGEFKKHVEKIIKQVKDVE